MEEKKKEHRRAVKTKHIKCTNGNHCDGKIMNLPTFQKNLSA